MVRAQYLTPEHLIRAMKAADFYASSGVVLDDVNFDSETRRLQLKIQPAAGVTYSTQFIATLKPAEAGELPAAEAIGTVVATVDGEHPAYELSGTELYVRALVTSSQDHVDPSLAGQKQQAWTQPVGWQRP